MGEDPKYDLHVGSTDVWVSKMIRRSPCIIQDIVITDKHYYSERIQRTLSNREKHTEQCQVCKDIFPRGSYGHTGFPSSHSKDLCHRSGILPTKGAHYSLEIPYLFSLGVGLQSLCLTHSKMKALQQEAGVQHKHHSSSILCTVHTY